MSQRFDGTARREGRRPTGAFRSHQALDVPEENGVCSDVQEHLLAPQLFVLSQEGEPCLGFLHSLHIPVLEREGQEVLRRGEGGRGADSEVIAISLRREGGQS